jgi:glutathione S-transferase
MSKTNPATAIITAFEASPDRGRGLARDTRVRWAFEEVGQPYDVRLLSFAEMKKPAHLALHPFGQIPTYEKDDLALFETGAIVLHIAERHAGLLPEDTNARARAIAWMFAALNTVEPPIVEREAASYKERDKRWHEHRLPIQKAASTHGWTSFPRTLATPTGATSHPRLFATHTSLW